MSDKPQLKVEDVKDVKLVNTKMPITIELERTFDPNRSKNSLMMTMEAATFTDPSTEEKVGEILHGIPADVVIRDKKTGEDWILRFGDLFQLYMDARKNLEENGPVAQSE